jgi:hypothetical protein
MKLFICAHCQNVLYFENVRCEKCGMALGFWAEGNQMVPLIQEDETWRGITADGEPDPNLPALRYCANAEHEACNWLVADGDEFAMCLCCRHNGKIPALADPQNALLWRRVERAKHRLFYTLLQLRLPRVAPNEDQPDGLIFDVLADPPDESGPKIITGHDNGRITLALVEAEDAERERRRAEMGEPYRSLLGHMRHEIGHYYWEVLVRDSENLEECRALFGDHSVDYGAALARHYQEGAPSNWQESFVSAYATAHPWEDFAESFAHYLHIMDTLEMAASFRVRLRPRVESEDAQAMTARLDFDPFSTRVFSDIIDAWLPLTYMANNLNRCMGLADLYPFTLTEPVRKKLTFIHIIAGAARFHASGA